MPYYCYLLKTIDNEKSNRTYIGFTTDTNRRLRQHNCEIKGGAKATHGRKWDIMAIVELPTKKDGLSFEWYWKHKKTRAGKWSTSGPGVNKRIERMNELIEESECGATVIFTHNETNEE